LSQNSSAFTASKSAALIRNWPRAASQPLRRLESSTSSRNSSAFSASASATVIPELQAVVVTPRASSQHFHQPLRLREPSTSSQNSSAFTATKSTALIRELEAVVVSHIREMEAVEDIPSPSLPSSPLSSSSLSSSSTIHTRNKPPQYCAYCKKRFLRMSDAKIMSQSSREMLDQFHHKNKKKYVYQDNNRKLHHSCRRTLQNKALRSMAIEVEIAHTHPLPIKNHRIRKCTSKPAVSMVSVLLISSILFLLSGSELVDEQIE
jgi:hypothetical protein